MNKSSPGQNFYSVGLMNDQMDKENGYKLNAQKMDSNQYTRSQTPDLLLDRQLELTDTNIQRPGDVNSSSVFSPNSIMDRDKQEHQLMIGRDDSEVSFECSSVTVVPNDIVVDRRHRMHPIDDSCRF